MFQSSSRGKGKRPPTSMAKALQWATTLLRNPRGASLFKFPCTKFLHMEMSGDVVLLPQILLISYNVTKSQRMILLQSFPLLVLDMRILLLRSCANFGIAVSLQFHCPFFFFLFLHVDLAANFGDRFRAEPLPGKGRERGCFPISSKWMKKEMENLLLRNVNRSAPNLRKFESAFLLLLQLGSLQI